MSDRVSRAADGSWTYGPDGYIPAGVRWVTADEIAAGNIGWWANGVGSQWMLFPEHSLTVPIGVTPTQDTVGSWTYSQSDQNKVAYYVAKVIQGGDYNSIPMTADELETAAEMNQTMAMSQSLDAKLGGWITAQAWLDSATQRINSEEAQWMREDQQAGGQSTAPPADNYPPADTTDQPPADQQPADQGNTTPPPAGPDTPIDDPNLDNAGQNAQTAGMDDGYYDDVSWYQDQYDAANYYDDASWYQDQYNAAGADTVATEDYSSLGYEDLGSGMWYDPSDNSVYDTTTGEWTYDDTGAASGADTVATEDYTSLGYEDLGSGMWYDPSDNSVYDTATGVWTYDDTAADGTFAQDGSFTDPISGTVFNADGSMTFPDGTTYTTEGNYMFDDGSQMLANGEYVDPAGDTWQSMAEAGAPNVWMNQRTGDVWNMNDGSMVASQYVDSVQSGDTVSYDQYLQNLKQTNPSEYARLTQQTTKPGSSGGSGGLGGGSGISLGGGGKSGSSAAGAATGGVTLADLNKLLQTAAVATQAVVTAKNSGASSTQIAALQAQAQKAAQAVTAAKAAGITTSQNASSLSSFLQGNSTILIVAGLGLAALLLLTKLKPTPAANAPAANPIAA